MSEITYLDIYDEIKKKIEENIYQFSELLPSENTLMRTFGCSRNTVRKALKKLSVDGYTLPIHGKGVKVVYQPFLDKKFKPACQLTLKQIAKIDPNSFNIELLDFERIFINQRTAEKTGLPLGFRAIHIIRRRLLGDKPAILEESFFLEDFLPGFNENIALSSVHDFIKRELDLKIGLIKRTFKIEKARPEDKELLELGNYTATCRIIDSAFDAYGNQFEWTSSRFHPDFVEFETIVSFND